MGNKLTDTTRVLMSFGAVDGGFEFAMQLRLDIYRKFGIDPASDGAFCYLDAESLRADPKTSYKRDDTVDKNFMSNPNWKQNYEAAMANCRTMILLITVPWLKSKWCWMELDMLVSLAERKPNLKTIVVVWPDANALLSSGNWQDRDHQTRNTSGLWKRINALTSRLVVRSSGARSAPGPADVTRNGVTLGTNTFKYGCTQAESSLILAQIDR